MGAAHVGAQQHCRIESDRFVKHERKSWQEVFESAAKWPDLRVWGMEVYKKDRDAYSAMKLYLRIIAKSPRVLSLSNDLLWAASKLSFELDPLYLY